MDNLVANGTVVANPGLSGFHATARQHSDNKRKHLAHISRENPR